MTDACTAKKLAELSRSLDRRNRREEDRRRWSLDLDTAAEQWRRWDCDPDEELP